MNNGPICWAYCEDGTICRRPAVAVDKERGCTVCEMHRGAGQDREEGETEDAAAESGVRA